MIAPPGTGPTIGHDKALEGNSARYCFICMFEQSPLPSSTSTPLEPMRLQKRGSLFACAGTCATIIVTPLCTLKHVGARCIATFLFRFLGVNVGLVLQPLNLRSRRRIRDKARFSSLPCKIRLEQLISVSNTLDFISARRPKYSTVGEASGARDVQHALSAALPHYW